VTPLNPSVIALLLVLLVGLGLYRRVRRLVGRQRLSRVRPWVQVTVLPLLIAMLGWLSFVNPARLAWLAAGVVAGAIVAAWGLRLTRFEETADGFFYTPNIYIGLTITALLVGRVAWRMYEVADRGVVVARSGTEFLRSGPTLAILGLVAGYYMAYAAGLLRWRFGAARLAREG
jgi:hypothetical protein